MVNINDLFLCEITTFKNKNKTIVRRWHRLTFLQTPLMSGFTQELGSHTCFCIQSVAWSHARESLDHFALLLHSAVMRQWAWHKQITSCINWKIVLTLRSLWKDCRVLQGSLDHTLRNAALRHSNWDAQMQSEFDWIPSVFPANCLIISHTFLACSNLWPLRTPDYPSGMQSLQCYLWKIR